ncbi:Dual specificity phosphatase catalytic domain [Phytophthora infestans]|uniref:Dual specificity phosphatase catalytic domain n=1 Tax=Phytophthora infestans TaxID=4787 RepID=A0A833SN86_PHYIN|nr:Dual specificity phosphatase catalytic domain [Phytophthora infestans]
MEIAPRASGGEVSNAKRKLESAHSFFSLSASSSPSGSPTAASNSYKPFRTNADALPPIDSHPKVRRCSAAGPPSLTRCYSDGKISKAFGELLTAEEAADSQRLETSKVCPTSSALTLPSTPSLTKIISPRPGVCLSPGLHRNPFLDDETWPLTVPRGPTSTSPAFVTKSYNNNTTPRKTSDSCAMFTPPTPNKRVCSQQGFTQSKAGATASSGNWAPSLTQARKRSLGASDGSHFASASSSDKRASLSIDMNLETRSNVLPGALSSCSSSSSTPPVSVLSRNSASVPKRMYPPQRRSRNPGNLSLDLSQVDQANLDPNTTTTGATRRRNDQAAVCSKLTDFLYIGGALAAKNKSMLLQNGITHVINCAASVAPASFPDEFCYFNIRLRDHSSQDIARHFYSMFDFIERARESGGRIFLHCIKGISRSPTMAIAYLMWYKNMGMYETLDFVRQSRPIVDPNAGFIFQLTEWEQQHPQGRLKFQRTIVFRMAYTDNVDKGNNMVAAKNPLFVGPLPSISDSFFRDPTKDIGELSLIVACADYMFVWCGTDVDEDQVEVAERGAQILQRYEAFPAKCDTVRQGQEPVAFWDLVGDDI